jgi:hypothetical protein
MLVTKSGTGTGSAGVSASAVEFKLEPFDPADADAAVELSDFGGAVGPNLEELESIFDALSETGFSTDFVSSESATAVEKEKLSVPERINLIILANLYFHQFLNRINRPLGVCSRFQHTRRMSLSPDQSIADRMNFYLPGYVESSMVNPNSVLKICCILGACLTANLSFASADTAGVSGSGSGSSSGSASSSSNVGGSSNSSSSTSGKPSKMLRSGAEDTEKMERSVKIMIPSAVPPTPRRQYDLGAQRPFQFHNPPVFSVPATAPPIPSRQFQLDVNAASHPFMPMRPPFLRPSFQPRSGGVGNVWTYGGTPAPLAMPRQPRNIFRMQAQPVQRMSIQVDPWTNVVEGEPSRAIQLANLQTAIKRLHASPQGAVQNGTQLMATQKVLPSLPPPKNWDEWYKRVAAATYDRWKQNTAGPGAAIVLIKVFDSRTVDCRVTEFTPATGADRDASSEQKFKEVALQCVSTLSGDPLWQFPATPPIPRKIAFDMEFKHAVGENAGCSVVHLHSGEEPDSDEPKK